MKGKIILVLSTLLIFLSGCSGETDTSVAVVPNKTEVSNIENDNLTKEQTTISSEHSHIHDGDFYVFSKRYTGIATDDSIIIWFNTTHQSEHLKNWDISATASPVKTSIYENCTVNQTGKSELDYYDKFRYYNDSSVLELYQVNEILKNGTKIVTSTIEGNKKSAGSVTGTSEGFHLRHNESYCIQATNLNGNDNAITMTLQWHHIELEDVRRILPNSLEDKWFG